MLTFHTRTEYMRACTDVQYHRDGSPACYVPPPAPWQWVCATCRGVFSHDTPHGTDNTNGMHCYRCSHARALERIKARPSVFHAYLSGDGRHVTEWSGGVLMRVVVESAGRKRTTIRAIDSQGYEWRGQGEGRGMLVSLRPCKS